jgi:hypothetical protein
MIVGTIDFNEDVIKTMSFSKFKKIYGKRFYNDIPKLKKIFLSLGGKIKGSSRSS